MAGGLDAGNRFLSSVESWSTRQGSSEKVAVLVYRPKLGTVEELQYTLSTTVRLSLRSNLVTPNPLTHKQVWSPPQDPSGGRHTRLRGRGWGWGDPIPTKGQKLWYSMYTITPLRLGPKQSLVAPSLQSTERQLSFKFHNF